MLLLCRISALTASALTALDHAMTLPVSRDNTSEAVAATKPADDNERPLGRVSGRWSGAGSQVKGVSQFTGGPCTSGCGASGTSTQDNSPAAQHPVLREVSKILSSQQHDGVGPASLATCNIHSVLYVHFVSIECAYMSRHRNCA